MTFLHLVLTWEVTLEASQDTVVMSRVCCWSITLNTNNPLNPVIHTKGDEHLIKHSKHTIRICMLVRMDFDVNALHLSILENSSID